MKKKRAEVGDKVIYPQQRTISGVMNAAGNGIVIETGFIQMTTRKRRQINTVQNSAGEKIICFDDQCTVL